MGRRIGYVLFFVAGSAITSLLYEATSGRFIPPLPDPGHRVFGATSESAAAAILHAIAATSDVSPKAAFDAGPTHQVVLGDDQRTVIAWFDPAAGNLPPNAISLAVNDPAMATQQAAAVFKNAGFSVQVHSISAGGAVLYVVVTNAFADAALVYRKPWYRMGHPAWRQVP